MHDTLEKCGEDLFPNIFELFQIFVTLPVTAYWVDDTKVKKVIQLLLVNPGFKYSKIHRKMYYNK